MVELCLSCTKYCQLNQSLTCTIEPCGVFQLDNYCTVSHLHALNTFTILENYLKSTDERSFNTTLTLMYHAHKTIWGIIPLTATQNTNML